MTTSRDVALASTVRHNLPFTLILFWWPGQVADRFARHAWQVSSERLRQEPTNIDDPLTNVWTRKQSRLERCYARHGSGLACPRWSWPPGGCHAKRGSRL